MAEAPRGRILDVTRLLLRIGRPVLTGIDRVERAYLEACLAAPEPLLLLFGRGGRQHLLAGAEGRRILGWLARPPAPDLLARLLRQDPPRRAMRLLAAGALARGPAARVAQAAARRLPAGGSYLNVGHLNLAPGLPEALRAQGFRFVPMIHDTIPLDFPQFSRPHAVGQMRDLLALAAAGDPVLANSRATEADLRRHGLAAPVLVAPLGVATLRPLPEEIPADLIEEGRPFFLALGTIEPRKNHALLLDVWEELARGLPADRLPQLVIAGRRGWAEPAFFRRLEASPLHGRAIRECGDLSDGAVAALIARTRALLAPSLAEGFGLPVVEAAAAGCVVLAHPLPVYRELLGDYPVYLSATDRYSWTEKIMALAGSSEPGGGDERREGGSLDLPTWGQHFNRVFTATC